MCQAVPLPSIRPWSRHPAPDPSMCGKGGISWVSEHEGRVWEEGEARGGYRPHRGGLVGVQGLPAKDRRKRGDWFLERAARGGTSQAHYTPPHSLLLCSTGRRAHTCWGGGTAPTWRLPPWERRRWITRPWTTWDTRRLPLPFGHNGHCRTEIMLQALRQDKCHESSHHHFP